MQPHPLSSNISKDSPQAHTHTHTVDQSPPSSVITILFLLFYFLPFFPPKELLLLHGSLDGFKKSAASFTELKPHKHHRNPPQTHTVGEARGALVRPAGLTPRKTPRITSSSIGLIKFQKHPPQHPQIVEAPCQCGSSKSCWCSAGLTPLKSA